VPQAEQRLRTAYTALGECGAPFLFARSWRHVGHDVEPEAAAPSGYASAGSTFWGGNLARNAGLCDRSRPSSGRIGARQLETDYRLRERSRRNGRSLYSHLLLVNDASTHSFPSRFRMPQGNSHLMPARDRRARQLPNPRSRFGKAPAHRPGPSKQIAAPVIHTVSGKSCRMARPAGAARHDRTRRSAEQAGPGRPPAWHLGTVVSSPPAFPADQPQE